MRLWTLHPRYLDARGIVALWRESLLARQVLLGRTRGYRHHPQLERFREHATPIAAIDRYLRAVFDDACRRGYRFDSSKLGALDTMVLIEETSGQIGHEWRHLLSKLAVRAPEAYRALADSVRPEAHPLFRIVPGSVRSWEVSSSRSPPSSRIA